MPVASLKAARQAMAALRARGFGRVHEMNTLYDTARQTLRKRGHLLRLRVVHGQGRQRWALLTHKGPSMRPAEGIPRYKEREESEVGIANPKGQERILHAAGFLPVFRYEKYRTSFRLPARLGWARSLLLELDETPAGAFWELEGPRRAIDRSARLLGYTRADYITKSYFALWSDYSRRERLPWGDMLFKRVQARPKRKKNRV